MRQHDGARFVRRFVKLLKSAADVLRVGGRFVATVDLFIDLAPFTSRTFNRWGTNLNLGEAFRLRRSGSSCAGDPAQLYGCDGFDARQIQEQCAEFYLGEYPCIPQCFVLEKVADWARRAFSSSRSNALSRRSTGPTPTFGGSRTALRLAGCGDWHVLRGAYRSPTMRIEGLTTVVPRYLEFPLVYGRQILGAGVASASTVRQPARLWERRFTRALGFGARFLRTWCYLLGLYGGELAMELSRTLRRPLVYRSHAIETQYHEEYFRLRRSSRQTTRPDRSSQRSWWSCGRSVDSSSLSSRESALTLEISVDDLARPSTRSPNCGSLSSSAGFDPIRRCPLPRDSTTFATSATSSCPTIGMASPGLLGRSSAGVGPSRAAEGRGRRQVDGSLVRRQVQKPWR